MDRICLSLPTNRECSATITAMGAEAAYAAQNFGVEVRLLILDSSDERTREAHARTVTALPEVPGVVVAARRNSPLVVGLGEGENFLGSDVSGFIDYTRRAVELEQDQVVTITPESYSVTDFAGNAAEGRLRACFQPGEVGGHIGQRLALVRCRQEVLRADAVRHAVQAGQQVLLRSAAAAATTTAAAATLRCTTAPDAD